MAIHTRTRHPWQDHTSQDSHHFVHLSFCGVPAVSDGRKVTRSEAFRPLLGRDRGEDSLWAAKALTLLKPASDGVPPLSVLAAELAEQRVSDRLAALVGLKVTFGNVGAVFSPVDEHVVPRQVFRRTGSGHQLVPLVGALKCCIDIEDDPSIVELFVMDDLTHEEPSSVLHAVSVAE